MKENIMTVSVDVRKKLVVVPSVVSGVMFGVFMIVVVGVLTVDSTVNNGALFVPLFVGWVVTVLGLFFSAVWFLVGDND
jgi:hypothetical protein